MKTKTNTLIEDGQNIKVKSVETDSIVGSNSKDLISYDLINNILQVGNNDFYISGIGIYSISTISINTETYGNIQINDEGFTFNVTNGVYLNETPFYFSPYTTAERPSNAGEGAVIYDSTLKKCILYNGIAWVNLDGTALA